MLQLATDYSPAPGKCQSTLWPWSRQSRKSLTGEFLSLHRLSGQEVGGPFFFIFLLRYRDQPCNRQWCLWSFARPQLFGLSTWCQILDRSCDTPEIAVTPRNIVLLHIWLEYLPGSYVSSVRILWPWDWPAETVCKKHLERIPFDREGLFGESLDTFMKEVMDGKSTLLRCKKKAKVPTAKSFISSSKNNFFCPYQTSTSEAKSSPQFL